MKSTDRSLVTQEPPEPCRPPANARTYATVLRRNAEAYPKQSSFDGFDRHQEGEAARKLCAATSLLSPLSVRSKEELQSELPNTRIVCTRHIAEIRRAEGADREFELCVIEDVEEFCPEL